MKIEPVRGCVVPDAFEPETLESIGLDVYPMRTCAPSDTPVLVIPLTPEAIEAMRERAKVITRDAIRVVIETQSAPAWYSGEIASDILSAIGITEEDGTSERGRLPETLMACDEAERSCVIPEGVEPHQFVGRVDRDCVLCARPDRNPIHEAKGKSC